MITSGRKLDRTVGGVKRPSKNSAESIDFEAMNSFSDLKLEAELVKRIDELGYSRPTALQREAIPIISRGTNAVGIASAGSGKTLAYGLGLAARLDPGTPGLQGLVLRPTDSAAAATAESLHALMSARHLRVRVADPQAPITAHVAVASPTTALAAVGHSAIKLNALTSLVVDGASAMIDLGAGEPLETVSGQVPKEAQRVLLSSRFGPEIEDWVERHARRARRLIDMPPEIEPLPNASVAYFAGPRERWIELLVPLLADLSGGRTPGARIRCRTRTEAEVLSDRLAVRGIFSAIQTESDGLRIDWLEEGDADAALSVLWGAPPDIETLAGRVRAAQRTVAFLEPTQLDHMQRLAAKIEVQLEAIGTAAPSETHRSIQATRDSLADALRRRDLDPYLLLLEPLFDEFSPAQVAAAATALLRERRPEVPPEPLPAWTKLYFAVGRRDGVKPGDLVGAIAGESIASGDQIGRIEIRDTHTLVEIAAPVADQVIKSLARTTVRGRPVNVRVYRE